MQLPITPIHFIEQDENGNRFYLKREDFLPFSFGGNKLRIALGYLEDFHREEADRLIAYGNPRSNLCRVLANLCAAESVPFTVISPADDSGERAESFNGRLCALFDAEIVPCTKQNVAETVDRVFADCTRRGEKPYYIYGNRFGQGREEVPPRAIAPVFDEIITQETDMGLHFDTLALTAATGMTLAGLAAGAILRRDDRALWGFSAARSEAALQTSALRYLNAWRDFTHTDSDFTPNLCCFAREGESYGIYGEEIQSEILRMMKIHGVPMDGTYTGKAWYALKQKAQGFSGKTVLFLHTGGTPLFFDALREM